MKNFEVIVDFIIIVTVVINCILYGWQNLFLPSVNFHFNSYMAYDAISRYSLGYWVPSSTTWLWLLENYDLTPKHKPYCVVFLIYLF